MLINLAYVKTPQKIPKKGQAMESLWAGEHTEI